MDGVTVISSPTIFDALTTLRDTTTDRFSFQKYAHNISTELFRHVFFEEDLEEKVINTPIAPMQTKCLKKDFVFVTILRAGLAFLPAVQDLLPGIPVGFIGLKRDEKTAIAHEYYHNLPNISSSTTVLLADPMLATGGSMVAALKKISEYKPKDIRVMSIVSAPEGIEAVCRAFPGVGIITAAIDEGLNDKKYIVPGLGDFGDRYFGTE